MSLFRSGTRGLSLALVLSSRAFAQAGPPTPDEFFARGVEQHRGGDVLGAIESYRAALEQEPKRIDARSNLGAAYVRLGRYEDAVREYRLALETDPQQAAVRFNLALALYKAARIEEAAVELQQVADTDAKNKAAVLLLADCELQRGRDERVVALLEPHAAELGDDRLYIYLLGNALLRRGEFDRGQALIDRLFQGGDSAPARLLMGVAHLRREDAAGALPELQKAAELDPKLSTVWSLLGRALMGTGRRPEATEAFRRELESNPNDFDSNLYLGLLLKDAGDLDLSFDHLKRAARLRPEDARVLYGLGGLHLAAGRIDEAEKALLLVAEKAPTYAQAHVLLATVYYRQKNKEEGDRHKAIAQRLHAEKQAQEPGASDELGPAYRGEDPPPDPAAVAQPVKKPDPSSPGGRQ
jgi:tetratricopeptide (TPR) repeat protein